MQVQLYINFEYSRICNHDRDADSYFNRSFSSTLLFQKEKTTICGKGFWKFSSSLTKD